MTLPTFPEMFVAFFNELTGELVDDDGEILGNGKVVLVRVPPARGNQQPTSRIEGTLIDGVRFVGRWYYTSKRQKCVVSRCGPSDWQFREMGLLGPMERIG